MFDIHLQPTDTHSINYPSSLNPKILELDLHAVSLRRATHNPNEHLLPILQEVRNLSNHCPAVLGELGVDSNERSSPRDLEGGERSWGDGGGGSREREEVPVGVGVVDDC